MCLNNPIFLEIWSFFAIFFIFLACGYTGLFHGLFKELEWVAIIPVKKVIFGWIFGLKEAKNDQKFADQCYMLSLII